MAEVGFYHLTRTGPDAALPKLLGRTLAAGHTLTYWQQTPRGWERKA